jgi:branched-chain amino acid transport system substrate-binding protein
MSRKRFPKALPALAVLVAAVLALAVAACGDEGASAGGGSDPVKIGLVVHKTGPYADTGRMSSIGARLAVEEINAAGGIKALDGAKIELVEEDAGPQLERAATAVNRALGEDIVAGIGTGISSSTVAATELAERRQIPWITVSFDDTITARGFKFVFATSPKTSEFTDLWAQAISELSARDGKKITRVAIIQGTNIVAVNAAKAIREKYAKKYGWQIVLDQTIEDGTLSDATSLVNKIRSTRPQLLLVGPTLPDQQKIARKEVELGMEPVPWVLSGAPYLSGAFLDALGEEGVNGTFAVAASAVFKGQEEVAAKVRAKGDPFPQQYHLVEYSHVYLLKEAIERAKSREPQAIRDALAKLDVKGGPATQAWPSGRVRFDETGRAIDRTAVVVQWQGGKTRTVFPLDMAEKPPIWPGEA